MRKKYHWVWKQHSYIRHLGVSELDGLDGQIITLTLLPLLKCSVLSKEVLAQGWSLSENDSMYKFVNIFLHL